MKAYILTEEDFNTLLLKLDRNPEHGYNGGGSTIIRDSDRSAYDEVHRFYNYQIHSWLEQIKK